MNFDTLAQARRYIDPAKGYHVQHLCEDLAIRRSDLAQATKRSQQALHRYFGPKASYVEIKTKDVEQVLKDLLTIRFLLFDLVKDAEKIRYWMRLPNQAFDDKSPIDLVREGRAAQVIRELKALVHGDHAR